MTPSGIEPATFRFVAQHLNHCATAVPMLTGTVTYRVCLNRECGCMHFHISIIIIIIIITSVTKIT